MTTPSLPSGKISEAMVEAAARAICLSQGEDPETLDRMRYCDANDNPMPLWNWYAEQARAALEAVATLSEGEGETCERCQGNGEIVTDWDRYLGPAQPGDSGDEGTQDCPDCDGIGHVALTAALSVPAPGTGGAEEPVAKLTVYEAFGGKRKISIDPSMTETLPVGEYDLYLAPVSTPQAGDLGAVKALRILVPDQDMPSPIDRLRLHATDPDTFAFSEDDALNLVDILNEAIATLVSSSPVGEMVLVPKAALDWLDGKGPDSEGRWFEEFPEGIEPPKERYWWRTPFRKMLRAAAPQGGR